MNLVFLLILILVTIRESYTEQTSDVCYEICPPGYHKDGNCDDPLKKHKCKKCEKGTYLSEQNSMERCLKCGSCTHHEKEIKACSHMSELVCVCNVGFYRDHQKPDHPCTPCILNNEDPVKKYEFCRRADCQNYTQCKMNTPSPLTTASQPVTKFKAESPFSWRLFVVFVVIVVLLLWILLLFTCFIRHRARFSCFSMNKNLEIPAEDTEFNEPYGHQGIQTTMTCNRTEKTCITSSSQCLFTSRHLSQDVKHKGEHQGQWPAILLHTIIKEVPLRRWKEFLRLLSVEDRQLERVELEAGFGQSSWEMQYQMLRLWSQRSSASLSDVFFALHHMDLSGCAQLLQESLEKLPCTIPPSTEFTQTASAMQCA